MDRSVKGLLQFYALAAGIVMLTVWTVPDASGLVWGLRIGVPAGAIVVVAILGIFRLRELVPDVAGRAETASLERDGLLFTPTFEAVDGVCRVSIRYQNRYSNPCRCEITLDPEMPEESEGQTPLAEARLEIACGGGEAGTAGAAYAVPAEWQGQRVSFEVSARTIYPQGKGRLVRDEEGVDVGQQPEESNAGVSLALAPMGDLHFVEAVTIAVDLPPGVAETIPAGAKREAA